MWNLDDSSAYQRVLHLKLPYAHTWADTRPGHTDREKRERIREAAIRAVTLPLPKAQLWAIRVEVWKSGARPFDIENVPKPIIDAFCQRQIVRDDSQYSQIGLYPDDRIDHVAMLQIAGHRTSGADKTLIEVFAKLSVD